MSAKTTSVVAIAIPGRLVSELFVTIPFIPEMRSSLAFLLSYVSIRDKTENKLGFKSTFSPFDSRISFS
jgi:hypothetical protein